MSKSDILAILALVVAITLAVITIIAYKNSAFLSKDPGLDLHKEYEFDVFTKESLTKDEMAEIAKACGCYIKEVYNDTHCLMAYKKNGIYTDEKLDETIKQLRGDDRVASASLNPSSRMEDDDPTDDEIIEIITLTPEAEN